MSRYHKQVSTSKKPDTVDEIVTAFLGREGFEQIDYNGSRVWKKGHGFIAPQYVMVKAEAGAIEIEGWLKFALLPGVYLGEMGVEGAFGAVPKRKLKQRLLELEELLSG